MTPEPPTEPDERPDLTGLRARTALTEDAARPDAVARPASLSAF